MLMYTYAVMFVMCCGVLCCFLHRAVMGFVWDELVTCSGVAGWVAGRVPEANCRESSSNCCSCCCHMRVPWRRPTPVPRVALSLSRIVMRDSKQFSGSVETPSCWVGGSSSGSGATGPGASLADRHHIRKLTRPISSMSVGWAEHRCTFAEGCVNHVVVVLALGPSQLSIAAECKGPTVSRPAMRSGWVSSASSTAGAFLSAYNYAVCQVLQRALSASTPSRNHWIECQFCNLASLVNIID